MHWSISIIAGAPFGYGVVLVFVGVTTYLVDAYTIYTASVLAAYGLLRSIAGCLFPLLGNYMYENLGIHWASSVPAFISLLCAPAPFILWKYGPAIRKRCKYASEAESVMRGLKDHSRNHPQ